MITDFQSYTVSLFKLGILPKVDNTKTGFLLTKI